MQDIQYNRYTLSVALQCNEKASEMLFYFKNLKTNAM